MPNLDGVSATAMMRMVAPQVPIVAMTSNIRQEDIQTYFQFGKPAPSFPTTFTSVPTPH